MNSAMNGFADAEFLAEELLASFQENIGAIIFLYIALLLYVIYLYISYSFTLVLIVDRKMRFWDAMELSRKVVAKNFFSFFGMYIVLWLVLTMGVIITCGLGLIIAFPYISLVVFSAYNDIIGPEEDVLQQNIADFGSDTEAEGLTE